ncbi:MAG: FtsB family cell division protein [Candidatus Dormibacteria bacterium]
MIRSRPASAISRPAAARRILACIVAAICGWIAFAVYSASAQSHALDSQVTHLRNGNGVLQQQIDDRRREIAQAQTKAWLEEQARKLGYVLPGETVYVIRPGASNPGKGGVDAKLPVYSPTPTPTSAPPVGSTPTPPSPTPTIPPLVLPH